jgi:ATP-binding cassette subfamily B protein
MGRDRRWLAPEVIQTSAMDCGPASLKCLLEGHGIPVSYGRLREACQTDVDGTSIDAIEVVANQLGLDAQQVMLPLDHLFLEEARALPAMVVTCRSDGAAHFVVIWSRRGPWLQVMDPAVGRQWVDARRFAADILRHRLKVPAAAWREWAGSAEFLDPLRRRLRDIGLGAKPASRLIDETLADDGWRSLASLDAAVRLVQSLADAAALRRGRDAMNLLQTLLADIRADSLAGVQAIPAAYWSVTEPSDATDDADPQLVLHGAVLMRVRGRSTRMAEAASDLSTDLRAALSEPPARPARELMRMLRADGILTPIALVGAMLLAVGAVLVESLLFRGLFDIANQLSLASQRLGAILGLEAFLAVLLLLELPIARESLRLGRHLEIRLRMALLGKLSRLGDRYFQSRPVSDMADRSHSLYLTRLVPDLAIHLVETGWDVLFTLIGIGLLALSTLPWALAMAAVAVVVPMLFQPGLNERDMRMRSHSGALTGFYLDALLGLVCIRTHSAQRAVRNEHEALLTEWARASRSMISLSLLAQGLQTLACLGLAGWMLWDYLTRFGVTGSTLLLVYWALKLPALGHRFHGLALQYPAQRNILLRLLEPLGAPDEIAPTEPTPLQPPTSASGMAIAIAGGEVVAAGHTILREIDVKFGSGEHVAVVGPSGAGKSTLIGVLLGWHRLAQGELRIDGEPADGRRLTALRRETAWVDPGVQLWNRPLLENLMFGQNDGDTHRLGDALEVAELRGLLQKLPEGLQTYLGESGSLVSGGEGQRVRLARALLQPGIRLALLDEPFRGLDRRQRCKLLDESRRWWKAANLVCVTHDVSETLDFDRVLVIEDGRIVEDGVPATLAEQTSRYRQLLDSERAVRDQLWQSSQWRRLRIEQGFLQQGEA